jgi:hypothetical protein
MKAILTLFAAMVLACPPALADPGDEVGELADHDKQPNAPGVVIVVTSDGAILLTNATPSDYPPPVIIVDGEVVNRF